MRTVLTLGIVIGAAAALGCGADEAEIQREFDALIEQSNDCRNDAECAVVSPGCPLGCFVAVHRDHQRRVERRARELIDDYESGGTRCAYRCRSAQPLACIEEKCGFLEPESPRADAGIDGAVAP